MTRPLIHIGMAKAASTFLQLELFPSAPGIHNLGKHKVSDALKLSIQAINRRVSIHWRDKADTFSQPLRDEIARAQSLGLRPVLSDEDFSVFKFLDPETMSARLHNIIGDYDVLFVLRDPLSWLKSHYLFRLQHQNPIAVFGFQDWLTYHFGTQEIGSDVGELWFATLADIYADLSGGQVHILSYDLLKNDKAAFAHHLATILGTDKASILDRLNAPADRAAHKISITDDQRVLFETFRWIETRQPDEFVHHLIAKSADIGCPVRTDHRDMLTRTLGDPTSQRSDWANILHAVTRALPADRTKPVLDFPNTVRAEILRNYDKNLTLVKRNPALKLYF